MILRGINIIISIALLITLPLSAVQTSAVFFSSDSLIPDGVKNLAALELDAATGIPWQVREGCPPKPSTKWRNLVFVLKISEAESILGERLPLLSRIAGQKGEWFAIFHPQDKGASTQFVVAGSREMLLAGTFELCRALRLHPSRFGNMETLQKPHYTVRITNDTPLNAVRWGYNTVESRWDATRAALFGNMEPPVFRKDDSGYKRALQNREALNRYLAIADALALDTIAYGDEFQFPRELLESDHYRPLITEKGFSRDELSSEWGMGRIFCFAKPRLWDLYREKYRSLFRDFPSIDYFQLRLGENTTFGRKRGYAGSGVYSIGGFPYCPDCKHIPYIERIARTIRETYHVVVREGGKKYIHRTWDTRYDAFNNDPRIFMKIADQIKESPGLYFSTKYTLGDFWEYFDYNPTLLAPSSVPRLVEFQCTREYEGKGAFPNFLGEEFHAVHAWLKRNKVPVAGVSNWHHGGGTGGPVPPFDLWNQANIYAAARLSFNPAASPHQIAREFGALYFGPGAAEAVARLLLLSDDAVRKWRYFRIYSEKHKNKTPAELWIRDDVIRGDRSLYRIFRYCHSEFGSKGIENLIEEKKEALELIRNMLDLLRSNKEAVQAQNRIYLPWGNKRGVKGVSLLLTSDDRTSEPLFLSGKQIYDFAETSLLYEQALAGVLYHYCAAYFLCQRYRHTLLPDDKTLSLFHLREWEDAWKKYTIEIPALPFCPSLFKDDGMIATLDRTRYFLENPAILDLNWRIIGPFPNPDKEGFRMIFPPERELEFSREYQGLDRKVSWKPLPRENQIDDLVDLTNVFQPDDWITMYAYTEVYCPEPMDVRLSLGSDDAVKLWLNGNLVHAHNVYRAAVPGQDRVKVRLKKGKNKILVKLMEGILGCGFYLQFTTLEGKPIPGLQGMS